MKIINGMEAGEQPSPGLARRIAAEVRPVLAVHGAGSALWAGTRILVARGWALLGRYLTGWERPAALAFAGYVAAHTAAQYPGAARIVVPAAAVGWCVTAMLIAPPTPTAAISTTPDADAEPSQQLDLDTLADVVRAVAEQRQGAHLAQLLEAPEFAGWTQSDLKAEILARGVPVQEIKLILGGRQRVRDGVRLRDLPPPAAAGPAHEPPLDAPADPAPRPALDLPTGAG